MQSSKYWKKRSIQRTTVAEKKSVAHREAIGLVYQRASKQVQDDINQIYKTYSKQNGMDVDKLLEKLSTADTADFWKKMVKSGDLEYIKSNYKARITRLEELQGELYSKVHAIRAQEIEQHNKSHTATINDAYHRTVFDTQKGVNANVQFGGLNGDMVDQIMNKRWQGSNYSERIWSNTDRTALVARDLLGSALLTGKSRRRVEVEMAQKFLVAQHVADRLIRTETNYIQNETEAVASVEMGLEEYVYIAVLDKRTSSICATTDTLKFKYKDRKQGENYPPLHPNCRSTTRPFVGDEYEPETRKARDADGNPITIKNMSYPQWRKAYDIDKPVEPKTPPKATAPKVKIKQVDGGKIKVKTQTKYALPVEPKVRGAVDPDLKATLRDGMNDVYQKYPQAFDRLDTVFISKTNGRGLNGLHKNGISTKKPRVERGSDGKSIYHSNGRMKTTAEINTSKTISVRVPQKYNDLKSYSRQVTAMFDRGWWATSNSKGVIYHELGHGLEQTMNMKHHDLFGVWDKFKLKNGQRVVINDLSAELRDLNSKIGKYTISNQLVRDTLFEVAPTGGRYSSAKKLVSEYGMKDPAETFAELFTKVMNNDKDQVTKVFKRNLDNKLKELELS